MDLAVRLAEAPTPAGESREGGSTLVATGAPLLLLVGDVGAQSRDQALGVRAAPGDVRKDCLLTVHARRKIF